MFSNLSSEECHIIKEEEEEESSEETSTTERIEHTGDKMQVHKLESNNINILKFCPLFNLLSKEFVSKLYMVQICGETLDGILLMTTDLMMYGLGNNRGGQLGIGHMSVTLQPVLIGILSGKKIKKLIYLNTPAVFALTEEGQVYSWGNNDCNILGLAINSFDKQTYSKFVLVPSLITSLRKERIVDIAACEYHAVGLAESGKVYMWGKLCYYEHQTENYSKFGTLDYNYQTENYSNFGTLDYINVEVPLVVWPDTSKQIKYICCGNEFTIAVTEEGVYGVGKNSEYQLGVNGASFLVDTSLRFKLIFPNDKIIKVACGSSHVMALDDEGHLYVWGSNEYGQLGKDKSTAKSLRKMLNEPEMGKIINIAALSHKNISVALNDKGRVYVWGFYLSQVLDAPMEINVSDMYKVFGCNLPYIICASPLKHSDNFEDTDKMSEIFQNIETMFDDYSLSDLTIRVQGQSIHVHKVILNIRSKYFRNMFQQTEWKKSNQSVIEHDEFSYDIYKCFLKYLYTGKIDLSVEKTFDLLVLADKYNETELTDCCIQILKNECTKENIDNLVAMMLNILQRARSGLSH